MKSIISERTRIALAILKSQGIKLGRPIKHDLCLILEYNQMGLSLSQISQETKLDKSTISKILKKSFRAENKERVE